MAIIGQLRGDTLANFRLENPILREREFVLVATDPQHPTKYNFWCCGDGKTSFNELQLFGLGSNYIAGITNELGESPSLAVTQNLLTRSLGIFNVSQVNRNLIPINFATKEEARSALPEVLQHSCGGLILIYLLNNKWIVEQCKVETWSLNDEDWKSIIEDEYTYQGIATPNLIPNTYTNLYYLAKTAGTYINFISEGEEESNINLVDGEIAILKYDNSTKIWTKDTISVLAQIYGQDTTKSMSQKAITDFVNIKKIVGVLNDIPVEKFIIDETLDTSTHTLEGEGVCYVKDLDLFVFRVITYNEQEEGIVTYYKYFTGNEQYYDLTTYTPLKYKLYIYRKDIFVYTDGAFKITLNYLELSESEYEELTDEDKVDPEVFYFVYEDEV